MKNKTIEQLFQLIVQRFPNQIAVYDDHQSLTYAKLNQKSDELAYYLLKQGAKPDQLIAVWMERNVSTIIAILGILKSGGVYVPLANHTPVKQVKSILYENKIQFLLTQESIIRKINSIEYNLNSIQMIDLNYFTWKQDKVRKFSLSFAEASAKFAYVIHTSGTSGKPKGVLIKRTSLANLINNAIDQLTINKEDKILQFSEISFDASIWEIFSTLIGGAMLYIPISKRILIGKALAHAITKHKITLVTLPPSILDTVSQFDLPTLKKVIVAGEMCSQNLANHWSKKVCLFNAYGPTEATVCTTIARVYEHTHLTIGRPIIHVNAYVLDENLNFVPIGIVGELYIGGIGVAEGYLNQPELTAQYFINNPFNPKERLYRTGDLVRWLLDGQLEYIGRKDNQVKIRGLRIELEAIEAHILSYPNIKQCIVTVTNHPHAKTHEKYLVAYLVTDNKQINASDLRQFLEKKLSLYMIPSFFIKVDTFPLTVHGKLDRKRLPTFNPKSRNKDKSQFITSKTKLETSYRNFSESSVLI